MIVRGRSKLKFEVGKKYLDENSGEIYVIIQCVSLDFFGVIGEYYVTIAMFSMIGACWALFKLFDI